MILAGGPARECESAVFRLHREGLAAQDVTIRYRVLSDPGGPRWTREKIETVAKCRQVMMDEAERAGRGLFLVDTDVIIGPGVLDRLLAVDADVVFGVFWTWSTWGGSEDRWPQVWDRHPYGFSEGLRDALDDPGVNEVPVLGGGACTLIRGRGFESRYWPLPESLDIPGTMWGGEDRAFSLGCELRGIRMVAVTGLPIVHLHDDHSDAAVAAAREFCGL